jgi:hypothetical protein
MSPAARLPIRSVHQITKAWRWAIVCLVPPLVALMSWAIFEILRNQPSRESPAQLVLAGFALLACAGLVLVLLAAVVWAFRARVTIDGDEMIVRGAFFETSITADRIEGFRHLNGQLYVYLTGRRWAVTIGGFENLWLIYRWVEARAGDVAAEMRAAEDGAIKRDLELGVSESAKSERLAMLHRIVRRGNWLIYIAAGVGFVNFLFVERPEVELIAVGVLILVPVFFDLFALSNRGHVKVDQDEGSRYPEIFRGTVIAGSVLAVMSLIDRGALLEPGFYEIFALVLLVKGFVWWVIDPGRFAELRKRGAVVLMLSVVGLFLLPGFWVGGSVYQINKLFDSSPTSWHATEVVDKTVSSGRTTSYKVAVAAWDEDIEDPLEITLRRDEFAALEIGQAVEVGAREGALGIAWVAALSADEATP